MESLSEKLKKVSDSREEINRIADINSDIFISECNDIINGILTLENSQLYKEIQNSLLDKNVKSLAYGIYRDIYIDKLFSFYHSEHIDSEKKEELFKKLSEVCKNPIAYFDFTIKEWIQY